MKTQAKKSYKVIPNLSLRGKDLRIRINNNSLRSDTKGNVYSMDEEMDALKKMSKADIHRMSLDNTKNIYDLQKEIKTNESNAKSEKEKATAKRIADLEKNIVDRDNQKSTNDGNK